MADIFDLELFNSRMTFSEQKFELAFEPKPSYHFAGRLLDTLLNKAHQ